ncbi:uncharacterized protein M421DRAFT_427184, partial [Didymella exigua CBS 183.55]
RPLSRSPSVARPSKRLIRPNNIVMDEEEVNAILVSNNKDNVKEVSNKAKQSPYTARALRFANLEVCTSCALEGFACTFSRDARKRGAKVRKSACDSNYKEEINAMLAYPCLEVKFAKRTTLACKEIL